MKHRARRLRVKINAPSCAWISTAGALYTAQSSNPGILLISIGVEVIVAARVWVAVGADVGTDDAVGVRETRIGVEGAAQEPRTSRQTVKKIKQLWFLIVMSFTY